MRREISHSGIEQLKYEIREIVGVARKIEALGQPIIWENIGDPINKGEKLPDWMKEIISSLAVNDKIYGYVDTKGVLEARQFLANQVNDRGGVQISADEILFFNGLGDAVARIFGNMKREARVLGPTPAYSTHSSAEAAHSGYEHLAYRLDPDNEWMPDLENLEMQVKYNDSIAGILVINPDNPTGAVYSREVIQKMVDIARTYKVFLIFDEIYTNIIYGGAEQVRLCDVIGDVPGMALRGISKEYPWPGSRCGWIEFYNLDKDDQFKRYAQSLVNAKMLEVCSTSLPQFSIPTVMGHPKYKQHLEDRAQMFSDRADEMFELLSKIDGISVIKPKGAFYVTILFNEGVLNHTMSLPIANKEVAALIESLLPSLSLDKRFVYYLLASTGICVVPLTGFFSNMHGFRITLLENDDEKRKFMLETLSKAISDYL